jgi:hypothetical protein
MIWEYPYLGKLHIYVPFGYLTWLLNMACCLLIVDLPIIDGDLFSILKRTMDLFYLSMDWFKEQNTGKPHDLHEKINGFRLRFSFKPIH